MRTKIIIADGVIKFPGDIDSVYRKKAKLVGTSAAVYLPKKYVGRTVMVFVLEDT